MLRAIIKHRDLLSLLVVREIRIRYARAFLGMAWALFIPLVMVIIFSALNFGRLLSAGDQDNPYEGVPYSLFAYCGLLFWTHFASSLTTGTNSLVLAGPLIKKCSFPRETIPLSKVLSPILDLLVGALFLVVLMIWHGQSVGWSVLALPLVFALQLAFTAGVVLLLASANRSPGSSGGCGRHAPAGSSRARGGMCSPFCSRPPSEPPHLRTTDDGPSAAGIRGDNWASGARYCINRRQHVAGSFPERVDE